MFNVTPRLSWVLPGQESLEKPATIVHGKANQRERVALQEEEQRLIRAERMQIAERIESRELTPESPVFMSLERLDFYVRACASKIFEIRGFQADGVVLRWDMMPDEPVEDENLLSKTEFLLLLNRNHIPGQGGVSLLLDLYALIFHGLTTEEKKDFDAFLRSKLETRTSDVSASSAPELPATKPSSPLDES